MFWLKPWSYKVEVRFLTVWSNLRHFLVHQHAVTNSIHLQSTQSPHLHYGKPDPHLKSSQKCVVELFCKNSQHVKVITCACRGAPLLMFERILNATLSEGEVSTTGVTQESLDSPCLLIFLIHTKHTKTIRWNFGLTSRLHFLEGELIHWVDKATKMWLIIRQLPINHDEMMDEMNEMLALHFEILAKTIKINSI